MVITTLSKRVIPGSSPGEPACPPTVIESADMSSTSPDINQYYHEQHAIYARFAPESFSWHFIERPAFDRHFGNHLSAQTRILDAGCGTGRTINYLLEKGASAQNITGIDLSFEMIEMACQSTSGVRFIQADLEHLPIPDTDQDLVVCNHVLHYLDNAKYLAAMKEFHRVLKTNSILFFVISHPVRTTRRNLETYFQRRWIMNSTPWGTQTPHFVRPVSDLVNLALLVGFQLEALDELEVDPAGQPVDPVKYEKYIACPPLLALKLRKPS